MGIWETNAFKGIIKDHRNDRRLMGAKKIHRDFIGTMGCLWIPMGLFVRDYHGVLGNYIGLLKSLRS